MCQLQHDRPTRLQRPCHQPDDAGPLPHRRQPHGRPAPIHPARHAVLLRTAPASLPRYRHHRHHDLRARPRQAQRHRRPCRFAQRRQTQRRSRPPGHPSCQWPPQRPLRQLPQRPSRHHRHAPRHRVRPCPTRHQRSQYRAWRPRAAQGAARQPVRHRHALSPPAHEHGPRLPARPIRYGYRRPASAASGHRDGGFPRLHRTGEQATQPEAHQPPRGNPPAPAARRLAPRQELRLALPPQVASHLSQPPALFVQPHLRYHQPVLPLPRQKRRHQRQPRPIQQPRPSARKPSLQPWQRHAAHRRSSASCRCHSDTGCRSAPAGSARLRHA